MERYAGKSYNHPVKSTSVTRYAQLCEDKKIQQDNLEVDDFNEGYRQGKLRYASASKHMRLVNAGLDTYVEGGTNTIWRRDGDSIVRLDNDLDWIDEVLKEENS